MKHKPKLVAIQRGYRFYQIYLSLFVTVVVFLWLNLLWKMVKDPIKIETSTQFCLICPIAYKLRIILMNSISKHLKRAFELTFTEKTMFVHLHQIKYILRTLKAFQIWFLSILLIANRTMYTHFAQKHSQFTKNYQYIPKDISCYFRLTDELWAAIYGIQNFVIWKFYYRAICVYFTWIIWITSLLANYDPSNHW